MSPEAGFDDHQAAWAEYTASPWARIRYAVVRKTLSESLARLGRGPLRILDVGGGDALDALPLAAGGHDVTVLDPSEQMLSVARERAAAGGVRMQFAKAGIEDVPTQRQRPARGPRQAGERDATRRPGVRDRTEPGEPRGHAVVA